MRIITIIHQEDGVELGRCEVDAELVRSVYPPERNAFIAAEYKALLNRIYFDRRIK